MVVGSGGGGGVVVGGSGGVGGGVWVCVCGWGGGGGWGTSPPTRVSAGWIFRQWGEILPQPEYQIFAKLTQRGVARYQIFTNFQQMSKSRCAPQLRYENRTCEVKAADAFLKRTCDLHFAGAILITQLRDFKTHLRSSLRRCDFHNADVISKRICDLHFAGAIFITQVGFQDASATFTSQVGLSYRRCDFKTQVQRF